uniref:Uncharacterized protein n=1 Tax=Rhizophora mucronata TaxID=61149 RepID=A0A2P2NCI8_RHIMU
MTVHSSVSYLQTCFVQPDIKVRKSLVCYKHQRLSDQ